MPPEGRDVLGDGLGLPAAMASPGQSQTQRNSICQVIDLPSNCFTKFLFLFYL